MKTDADRRRWAERMHERLVRTADHLGIEVEDIPTLTAWVFGHRTYEEDLEDLAEFLAEGSLQRTETEWKNREAVDDGRVLFSKEGAEQLRKLLKGNSAQLRKRLRRLLEEDAQTWRDRGHGK